MSSQAEDIIRETFSSLAKAIGVQIDIPDEMIANLAARLQAQIDLLAELHSAGRLLAADEMRLTAEQVEDVEALVATANPYSAPAARLRALFPATEPAEEPCTGNLRCEAPLHAEGCYATHRIPPGRLAPAEPAEEETKAEGPCEVRSPQGDTCSFPKSGHAGVHTWAWPDKKPASSPVVPAPTETGPWETVDAIPGSVTRIKDCEGDVWHRCTAGWEHGGLHGPEGYAPFVAAEEG
ncbi:hypothetical protein JCM9803A_09940 [Rhodococcus erythropolis]